MEYGRLNKIKVGYIQNSQLTYKNMNLLPRIGECCETCNNNKGFTLIVERNTYFTTANDNYHLQCDNCVEYIGLEVEEVVRVEKIAKLNELHSLGKISEEKYEKKLAKHYDRLHFI
jgi:hypothetical protein